MSTVNGTSKKRISLIGLPLSSESICEKSSRWASTRSASRQIALPRSCGVVNRHGPFSAARAALTARSTSVAPPRGARAIWAPVAGSNTGNVSPEMAAVQVSPISILTSPSVYSRTLSERVTADIETPSSPLMTALRQACIQ